MMNEHTTALALNGYTVMHLKIRVTDEERQMIQKAADSSGNVSMWAEVNLVDLARIETSGGGVPV